MTHDDEDGWTDTTITIFGQRAALGWKFPTSRVKRVIVVTADGKGGRTRMPPTPPEHTETDLIRGLIAGGATTVADVKAGWLALMKPRRLRPAVVTLGWNGQTAAIAGRLLKGRRIARGREGKS
jgi:hypothetical protein